jgi:hypothetical protein
VKAAQNPIIIASPGGTKGFFTICVTLQVQHCNHL